MNAAVFAFKEGYEFAMQVIRNIAEDCAPHSQYEKFNDRLFWESFIQVEKYFKAMEEET